MAEDSALSIDAISHSSPLAPGRPAPTRPTPAPTDPPASRESEERAERSSARRPQPETDRFERSSADPQELQEVARLRGVDRAVRAHEAAHQAAAGPLATGGPTFEYTEGPDGQRYAVGGEVPIQIPEDGPPAERLAHAEQAVRAALAPADPSGQDLRVAAEARALAARARAELRSEESESASDTATDDGDASPLAPTRDPYSDRRTSSRACPVCGEAGLDHSHVSFEA